MKAFLNDKKIQDKYLKRIRAHAKADEFIKGTYWEKGKGCAVGCTVHSSSHAAYETELGIPQWLAILEDRIFEGMSNNRSMKWPVKFLEAINIGSNLEKIKLPMLIFIVEAREKTKNKKSLQAIDGVLAATAGAIACADTNADVAQKKEYEKFADKLLELIRECK